MEQNPILFRCRVSKNIPNNSHPKSNVYFAMLWGLHKRRWLAGVCFLFQSAWPFEMILFLYYMQLKYSCDSPPRHFSVSIAFPTRNCIWMVQINEKRVENKFILIGNKHTDIQDHVGDLWAGKVSLVSALQKWSVNTLVSNQQNLCPVPRASYRLASVPSDIFHQSTSVWEKNKGRTDSLFNHLCSYGT